MTRTRIPMRSAVASGVSAALGEKWMVVLFYATNLALAAVIAAPMHSAIATHLGKSTLANDLARGLSAAWLNEFQIAYATFLAGFSQWVMYAALFFLLLNNALSAGAFEIFALRGNARNERGLQAFGYGVGRYFGRFLTLGLIASLFYFVVFNLLNLQLERQLGKWTLDSPTERWHFYSEWARILVLALAVMMVNAMVEVAKADIVAFNRRSVPASLGRAAGFVISHFRSLFSIYLGFAICAALAIAAYALFARYFPQASAGTVFLWFLVAQFFIALRWLIRIATWAAVTSYYRAHSISGSF